MTLEAPKKGRKTKQKEIIAKRTTTNKQKQKKGGNKNCALVYTSM